MGGTVRNETGPEYAYDYVASCDGELTVTLNKTSGASSQLLDLFANQCVPDFALTCGGSDAFNNSGEGATNVIDSYCAACRRTRSPARRT